MLVGREEFKWRTIRYRAIILVHTVQLKPMIIAHSSGKMVSSGISDVVVSASYTEKTRLKKLMKMIIIITRAVIKNEKKM